MAEKRQSVFANLKVKTLLCTIHDIFGYIIPHVDVDKRTIKVPNFRNYRVLEDPTLTGIRF